MAVTNASSVQIHGHTQPAGPNAGKVAAADVGDFFMCFVSFVLTGTYAQANNSAIVALATAIQNSKRNGKTVTLQGAMLAAPGIEEVSSVATITGAKTIAISGADVTFECTSGDVATTEHANAAFGSFDQPLVFAVMYSESPG